MIAGEQSSDMMEDDAIAQYTHHKRKKKPHEAHTSAMQAKRINVCIEPVLSVLLSHSVYKSQLHGKLYPPSLN